MLKALELNGFKSFADKTRFEFPPGITVVVGPNGSGKSNIVDAIKWVLGEQSAKSLRGKDMSDVIFKGSSGAGARRPSNSATATIVLDNLDRRFAFDADEVHVSRRVYRSGESEYLVNGETSRLKDIKELFRGTGVGTDAYSLIEQGKVERMLSTNAKDRRAIFEEAAGISRFKAKKIEAQRRLARVDGNLIRLADIVEEVGSRYRSVKAQASKAARYKEFSDRLQQLRTAVGLKDFSAFNQKIAAIDTEAATALDTKTRLTATSETLATDLADTETKLESLSAVYNQNQEAISEVREQIAQAESQISLNRSRLSDIESRKSQLTEQWDRSSKRTKELETRIATTNQQSETAEIDYRDSSDQLKQLELELNTLDQQILSFRSENETRRSLHAELMTIVTGLGRSVSAYETQTQNVAESRLRHDAEVAQLLESLNEYQLELDDLSAEQQRLQTEAESRDADLKTARQQFEDTKSELAATKERLSDLTSEHAGLSQRAAVIEELESSLEGVAAGAKEILTGAHGARSGPLSEVIGLVADLVSVNVQHAAIVDVALGELAQYVIVDGDRLVNEIADETFKLNGRVGLIQLKLPPTLGANPDVNLNGAPGVIGRTDRLVQVQPEFQTFIRQLLGGTWVVKTLAEALHLHQTRGDSEAFRLVTLDGEIVEPDGTVVAGPKSSASGLVSRRSELRALKRQIQKLDEQIADIRESAKALTARESQFEIALQNQINENAELTSRLRDQEAVAKSVRANVARTEKRLAESRAELDAARSKLDELNSRLANDKESLASQELEIATLSTLVSANDSKSNEASQHRSKIEKEATIARVKLAKSEQVLEDIQSRANQVRQELEEHQTLVRELTLQQESDASTETTAHEQIETAMQALTELKVTRDETADQLSKLAGQRTEFDEARRKLAMELSATRDAIRQADDRIHQSKMRIEQIAMQRDQLAERMLDDYQIDLSQISSDSTAVSEEELAERESVDAEISSLRKKISDIGSVNLDALAELEELESRYTTMDAQYQDLVQAKQTLEKIISRIDIDSRKLFVETLEAIRINFQKLFRQTFGGGQADIILEEGVDPLEAGVEIIATPPGKSQFNNSLLSGGEKALTAVSLLMAIFQFRPSPFCVLDEVDAPFDEANIGRFIDVLKSFLGWTRFVIVTHSKKTMTAATTLYGITMQESGVSKRVSVRFEDVTDDGQISTSAISRTDEDAA